MPRTYLINQTMSDKKKIDIQGLQITVDQNDYVSITDLARGAENPSYTIINWLRNSKTLRFLETWEKVHNENFKVVQMHNIRMEADSERQLITPGKYIEQTNAIGLISKRGRYGGTYAHHDIALHFCFWYEPEFQVYLVKEFKRLKEKENELAQNTIGFSLDKIINEADNIRIMAELGKASLLNLKEEE